MIFSNEDLFDAIAQGKTERVVRILPTLSLKALREEIDAQWGSSWPLITAIRTKNDFVVRTLIDCVGANPHRETDPDGVKQNLLHVCAEFGTAEILENLLARGIKQQASVTGYWPLHLAAAMGNLDQVKLLLAAGADVNARSNDWESALILSLENTKAAGSGVPEYLVEAGADFGPVRENDRVPVHMAVEKHLPQVVALMLERGVDTGQLNPSKQTLERHIRTLAERRGAPEVLAVFRAHRARQTLGEALSKKTQNTTSLPGFGGNLV